MCKNILVVLYNVKSETEILLKFASKIRELRFIKNVSQLEAYNDTGIHFGRIEQGKRNVSLTTIFKLAEYFKVSPKDLLD